MIFPGEEKRGKCVANILQLILLANLVLRRHSRSSAGISFHIECTFQEYLSSETRVGFLSIVSCVVHFVLGWCFHLRCVIGFEFFFKSSDICGDVRRFNVHGRVYYERVRIFICSLVKF